jgi:hypothetical protein
VPRLRPSKPATHNADLANLPAALCSRTQEKRWVVWSWRWQKDRWDKPPLQAHNPTRFAKSDDPATWAGYADALAVVGAGQADGIGYMLAGSDLGAVDLDHCRDPNTGTIDAWAQTELDAANSYVEITASGTGLRILGIGSGAELQRKFRVPSAANGAAIEVYRRTNRYITVTGAEISGGAELINIDAALDNVVARYETPIDAKAGADISIACGLDIDDLIRNGAVKGQRSEAFSRVVWSLAGAGHSIDEIQQKLAAHPGGIATKYNGRLDREVERCFRKWQMRNPKRATSGETPMWPDCTEEGEPKRSYRNAREAINALGIICSNDEFHDRMLVGGHPIQQWAGELSDAAIVVLRQMIVDTFDFDPGKDHVADAAIALCLENRFNPIVDYLDSLDWDGTHRLDTWLISYLGAEDTPLNRAFSKLTLVAAVRRVRKPGCKFDQILVLEGPEGVNKSTAIVVLAGMENFSDQTILTASDKEQQELVRGVWFFELADLAGMKRSEVEKVKAFGSRTHDRARPAYGRHRVDAPRRCVFIGTTNDDEYLKSETGNRRFWPLKVGTIDIEALRHDRDQLFAEAAEVEAKGEPLTLPKELWAEAGVAQEERRQHDPWDDILAGASGVNYRSTDDSLTEQEWVKARDLLVQLQIAHDRATPELYKRLKRVMRRLGWESGKHYFCTPRQERGYWRPARQ